MIVLFGSSTDTATDNANCNARLPARTWCGQQHIRSKTDAACARSEMLAALQYLNWSAHDVFAVGMAVEEALVKAITNRKEKAKDVSLSYEVCHQFLRVEIKDLSESAAASQLDDYASAPSGRGLLLMAGYMDRVVFDRRGNGLVMEKRANKWEA